MPSPARPSLPGLALALALLAAGCAGRAPSAELSILYDPAARHHGVDRNPVIAIPGILGTRLVERPTGRLVWGAFEPGAADPARPEDARLLALPIGDEGLGELRDEIEPDGVLERVRIRLAGIALEIQAYAGILATLGAGGYRDEALGLAGEIDYGSDHFTCFQFDYDWRRDNVENAQRLAAFVREKRAEVQAERRRRFGVADSEVRFDIVAHSMGGLVARYFLMYGDQPLRDDGSLPELTWAGAPHVARTILVGTPNAGALDALVELVEGRQVGPLLPYYPPALLGTFPSIYQLLPRSRHRPVVWDGDPERPVADLLDPALWERLGWGLASPRQAEALAILLPDVRDPAERRARALALQRRALARARSFQAALDRPAVPPPGTEIFLVAGDAAPTPRRASVRSADGTLTLTERAAGDGTVLRTSALLDERPGDAFEPRLRSPLALRQVLFLPDDHLGLTNGPVFRDNVLYWLLEDPRGPLVE